MHARDQKPIMENILNLDGVDTDGFVDEQGRNIRWTRFFDQSDPTYEKKCVGKGERLLSNLEAEKSMKMINKDLYERLEARKRAISNW